MNIEEMRLMKTEEEVRNRARELLLMPKVEIITKYMFQEQEIERLNNIINEIEKDIKNLYTYGIKNNAEQRDYLLNRLDGLKENRI